MNISSILPAFNEETNITTAISSIIIIFKKLKIDQWELIVVNDGSSDKTKELVEAILQESRVKIINHSKNKGYGETLYSGLGKAQYDWIFITDSDLQFFIEDLILLENQKILISFKESGKKEMINVSYFVR